MVGTGTASQQGILVKGGAALETATRITHIVFDKTGTLTFGKLKVADVQTTLKWKSEESRKTWWTVVGLAESGSEHPIGRSILAKARETLSLGTEDQLPGQLGDFHVSVGQGVTAIVEQSLAGKSTRYKLIIGNEVFFRRKEISIPETGESNSLKSPNSLKANTGITTIYVAIDGEYAGKLGLSDTLKPTAAAAITALHRMGISTSIITGDTFETASSIARLVGIPTSSVRASVSPSEKQEIVAELQSQGEIVAMVGDGVNDSPALATANVGVGLVSGSDIAVEAADIVIMRSDDLLNVPAALWLCRIIFRRIKMNLIWACGYNVIGLPFAMGIFLPFGYHMPPLLSATAMMFSSISVTLSSLALRWAGRPKWLNVEDLEMESSKIAVPVRGEKKKLSGMEALQGKIMGIFDTGIGKRRRFEGDRGTYVPLRTVDGEGAV
jgi:Cu+-exporting ATPase